LKQKSRTGYSTNEKRFRHGGLIVLAMLFFFSCICVLPAAAANLEIDDVTGLQNVITWSSDVANKSEPFHVVVNGNIGINGSVALPAITGDITLTTNSSANNRIYRTEANTSVDTGMFTIGSGGKLTIADNGDRILTLDGNNTQITGNTQSLFGSAPAATSRLTAAPYPETLRKTVEE